MTIDKMRLSFIILLLVTWTYSIACTCNRRTLKETQETSIKQSPLIFIGDVIEFNNKNRTYKLKIVEILKGEAKTNVIEGASLTSCSGFADKGRWIVYADTYDNGIIDFTFCGLSRSFENPHLIYLWATDYKIPGPPPKGTSKKQLRQQEIENKRTMTSLRETAKKDLEAEIEKLRKKE
jgi:hypothetical protein